MLRCLFDIQVVYSLSYSRVLEYQINRIAQPYKLYIAVIAQFVLNILCMFILVVCLQIINIILLFSAKANKMC